MLQHPRKYTKKKWNEKIKEEIPSTKLESKTHRDMFNPLLQVHTSNNFRGCVSAIMLSLSFSLFIFSYPYLYIYIFFSFRFPFLYSACGLSQGQIGQGRNTKRMHDFLHERWSLQHISIPPQSDILRVFCLLLSGLHHVRKIRFFSDFLIRPTIEMREGGLNELNNWVPFLFCCFVLISSCAMPIDLDCTTRWNRVRTHNAKRTKSKRFRQLNWMTINPVVVVFPTCMCVFFSFFLSLSIWQHTNKRQIKNSTN